ncbi:hypothetical protein SMSP2_01410 [Limihaloglobus sulfuriphilus]|uniref:Uncharacterized protein n=2 Tax=Limihaloglobus sulfuriphilus TaxID=1851148 RepID=A0A1Q2MEC1_9BACT|nr:hypothetical protein SMSP2_01410 [Limihaloglobus sulfuriphilus]
MPLAVVGLMITTAVTTTVIKEKAEFFLFSKESKKDYVANVAAEAALEEAINISRRIHREKRLPNQSKSAASKISSERQPVQQQGSDYVTKDGSLSICKHDSVKQNRNRITIPQKYIYVTPVRGFYQTIRAAANYYVIKTDSNFTDFEVTGYGQCGKVKSDFLAKLRGGKNGLETIYKESY